MDRQLIILGNGFDLTAKLKSKYSHFFEEYFKGEIENIKEQEDILSNVSGKEQQNNLRSMFRKEMGSDKFKNFWMYYFFQKRYSENIFNENWADIETEILNVLLNIDIKYYGKKGYYQVKEDLTGREEDRIIRQSVRNKLDIIEGDMKGCTNREFDEETLRGIKIPNSNGGDFKLDTNFLNAYENLNGINPNDKIIITSKGEFIGALFKDLLDLEKEFASYLAIVSNSEEYRYNARRLLDEIIFKNVMPDKFYDVDSEEKDKIKKEIKDNTNVLSFNYTKGYLVNDFNNQNNINPAYYCNVHGNLGNDNIIFGIDNAFDKSIEENKNDINLILPFTKTYRIMDRDDIKFELKKDLKLIKFYGHSLAQADYSYFQTIFDDVDLYNSETVLIFYYSVYSRGKEREIREKNKRSVHNLISVYGSTMDNKDHGKNLLHKLLLEGRVKIKELDIFSLSLLPVD
ncbi:MAG: bacteriophage abortive infection AbiH family protein [Lachnospiraceae bacterium]|jgi:hypothetical protein|nr:bacteriophage abortive infection AbiH family protein [Lachnospiraceae bacterium]